jgi:ferrochelatase
MPDVVLCNFGGPTHAAEVEPFLRSLFEDPFILRSPWLKPWMRRFLAKRIAAKRAPNVTHEYERIGFSPINKMTEIQAALLEAELKTINPDTTVHVVNRYTRPFAEDVVGKLRPTGRRLFVTSLYPHTCHSTTVSSYRDFDLAFEARHGVRDVGSVRVFSWWHNRRYIDWSHDKLVAKLREGLKNPGPLAVVFSAHGLPMLYNNRGDPYVNEITAHFVELRERAQATLGVDAGRVTWHLSFQSRVGPVEWVKPYTEVVVQELGAGSHKGGTLLMVPVSFTADHIETLHEMDVTYKKAGLNAGFAHYLRVAPANDDRILADVMRDVLVQMGFR